MGYDAETTQREAAKNQQAWKVIVVATVSFLAIGMMIWFGGFGGKY
ncbi:hypothetical protein [Nitrosomonas sp. HPC101]|nr:hypothetical protein [Nitrosomonas sp. HPC101]